MSIFKDLLNNARNEDVEPSIEEKVSSKNLIKREGKRSHPDYRQTTIYINKDLHRKIMRKLEDSGYSGDFSQWIEDAMLSEVNK